MLDLMDDLSEKELAFANDLWQHWQRKELTEKQYEWLDRIYLRLYGTE